jgi:diacylglycerol kinase family enzyme
VRVTVVHNPSAGDDTFGEREIRGLLRAAGHTATFRSTKAKGWKAALDDPGDLVVVAGGDGTVAKVARHLAGRGVPMTLLPAGTANNIARTLGLEGDAEELVARWTTGCVTPIDLGIVTGSMGERAFIEGVGLGVFPDLMAESQRLIAKDHTPIDEQIPLNIELMIELLARADPMQCEVTADGKDLSGAYLILEVLNIRSIGPRVEFSSNADPTDGLLDIVAITEAERNVTIDFLRCCSDGKAGSLDVPRVRARQVQLAWEAKPLHIDDDRWPDVDHQSTDRVFAAKIAVEQGVIEILR